MTNELQVMDEAAQTALPGELMAPSNILSTERFALTDKYAAAISRATLLPDHLRGNGPDEAYSNCFLVVNQALTWGVDPLAVAQATAVVHGKLCYEGKLVQAVLNMNGIRLHTRYEGDRGSLDYKILLSDQPINEDGSTDGRLVEGSVSDWATFGSKKGGNSDQMNAAWKNDAMSMLHYRGHRQWSRLYEPGLIMGVYTSDEMANEFEEQRAKRARDVTKRPENNSLLSPDERLSGKQTSSQSPAQARSRSATKEGGTSEDDECTPHSSSSDKSVSMSRNTFELYAQNLSKLRTLETLSKGDAKFSAGLRQKPNQSDVKLFKAVYTAHANRINAKVSVDDCAAHVTELIGEAYN